MPSSAPQTTEHAPVRLTPLDPDNIYTHFDWNNDPELNRFDSELPFEEESFGAFKKRFEQMAARRHRHSKYFEVHASDGTLIGVAYIISLSEHNRHGTIGVTIGNRDYWNEDYGLACFGQLLAHCFEEMELHRVTTELFEYHDAWQDLVEKVGFHQEGRLREYLYRDDRFWDKVIYGMLASEYRAAYAGDGELAAA